MPSRPLRSAADFAPRRRWRAGTSRPLAEAYDAAAEVVREAIERELWSEFHGRYLRSIGDPTLDVSLLGLAWPFAAVDPAGERMRATVAALEAELGDAATASDATRATRTRAATTGCSPRSGSGSGTARSATTTGHRQALEYAVRVARPISASCPSR